jgi:hypothetical protein
MVAQTQELLKLQAILTAELGEPGIAGVPVSFVQDIIAVAGT